MTETTDPGGGDPAPELAAAPMAGDLLVVAQRAITAPATVDRAARTVEVVWSTGARARNFVPALGLITEELEMSPNAVRMDALRSGRAPVLDTHRRGGARDVLGRVTTARLERGRGLGEVVERGAPARFGGMGRQHRHDEQPVEELLHLVRSHSGRRHRRDGRGDGSVERRRTGLVARAQRSDPVQLLGRVDEVEEPGERLGQQRELLHGPRRDRGRERRASAAELSLPQRDRGATRVFHEGERSRPVLLRDGLAQHTPEEPHVFEEPRFVARGHARPLMRRRAGGHSERTWLRSIEPRDSANRGKRTDARGSYIATGTPSWGIQQFRMVSLIVRERASKRIAGRQ